MAVSDRRLRIGGVALVALTAACLGISSACTLAADAGAPAFGEQIVAQNLMVLALGGPGAWLLLKVPRHPAGWLLMSVSSALVLNSLGGSWAVYATTEGRDLPLAALGLVGMRLAVPLSEAGVPLLLLLFPDGHLPSRRWKPAVVAVVVSCATVAGMAFAVPLSYLPPFGLFAEGAPDAVPPSLRSLPDLTGLAMAPGAWWDIVVMPVVGLELVVLVLALISLVARYRGTNPTQRAQLRWLALGGLAMLLGLVVSRLTAASVGMAFWAVMTLVLATTVVIAVLKYRLGDAAVALNRSVVYMALSALVIGLYAFVVATVTVTIGDDAAPWLAAAVVAVAFAPLRSRLQEWVDRQMRGERADPYRVVSSLSRRLETSADPHEVLRATVDTLWSAFRAHWVRIELDGDDVMIAERGTPSDSALVLPLEGQGERYGRVALALPAGTRITERDRLLIADLVRHSSAMVRVVSTAASLQRARAYLVASREDERRRLRRDLHDGLGPQLAGLTLKLDAVRNVMPRDPDRALDLVAAAKGDVTEAVADVRRLVHDLRPPALDEVGLLGALQQQVARFRRAGATMVDGAGGPAGFDVVLETPRELGALPAAVEVAAYRITSEALTNVARHARASRCEVRVDCSDPHYLDLTVSDDGIGLNGAAPAGLGLVSMRERAAEVGGRCEVGPGQRGGTVVAARLPVAAP